MREPSIADLARAIESLIERMDRETESSHRATGKKDTPRIFTDEEIEQIKRGAQIVEWFDTAGWMGRRLLAVGGSLLLLISQWEGITKWLAEWVGGSK